MRISFLLCLALTFSAVAHQQTILFVGNSFTYGAEVPQLPEHGGVPKMVEAIARAKGHELHAESVTSGGKDWSWHLSRPATAAALQKKWDWVVLQDFSTRPTRIGNIDQFMKDGQTFFLRIGEHSPFAKIVLYETWSRPPGAPFYNKAGKAFAGPAGMMSDLHRSYRQLGHALSISSSRGSSLVAPVGDAFTECRQKYPTLVIDAKDQHHASAQGYYLAALVIFETLYHEKSEGAPTRFFDGVESISASDAVKLQHIADEAVETEARSYGSESGK